MKLFELTNSKLYRVIDRDSVKLNNKRFVQHPVDARGGYKLVLVNADLLERMWAREGEGWVIGPGPEYKNQIKNRIANFKQFYDENDEIRVGDVHINERGRASFGDGRHRTRVLIELGFKWIPVSMTEESIQNLSLMENREKAKHIATSKKNKAKRANPKANKNEQLPYSGGGVSGGPSDTEAGMGSTTHGSRYQGSTSTVNNG
jgi:hypothetical protein